MKALAFLILSSLLTAQTPSRKQITPTPGGISGYSIGMFLVFKDAGCARDFEAAMAAGGIAKRKQLGDLMTYECMEFATGIYRGASLERRSLPTTNTVVHRVALICTRELIPCNKILIPEAWVLDRDFTAASDDKIQAAITALSKAQLEQMMATQKQRYEIK